jgi:hypothetical protein
MDFLPEIAISITGVVAAIAAARVVSRKQAAARFHKRFCEIEMAAWNALRHEPLSAAEQATATLLHVVGDGKRLPPYLYASALYTHGCLLVEEESTKYAVERFSSSMSIARNRYGFTCPHAVPPAVALAYLHYLSGNLEKSAKLLAHGLFVYREKLGADHPRTARVKAMLALVAFAVGFVKEAQADVKAARDTIAHGLTPDAELLKHLDGALYTMQVWEHRHPLPDTAA